MRYSNHCLFAVTLYMQIMAQKLVSVVVRLGDVAYYMHSPPVASETFGVGQVAEPCTVLTLTCEEIEEHELARVFAEFNIQDDVWSSEFLSSLIIQTTHQCSLSQDVRAFLQDHGVGNLFFVQSTTTAHEIAQGPYFLNSGRLHQAYRLYPDTAGAFVVATVPNDSSSAFRSLDAAAYGEEYPAALTIAVPSRLSQIKTEIKPFAGLRIAIKDTIDLKGLKTGASSREYTAFYPVRSESAKVVQRLVDLGFVIVGKVKTTQFADSEWSTCDWIDYHAPFNPRGDGYLTTSGSSAGSAAAIASYNWLDFTLATDTLGSIRAPAAAQGIFGMRPSLGAASFQGIVPYSPLFDTIGGFARTAEDFRILAHALYGTSKHTVTSSKRPTKLLYPSDYWPVPHAQSQSVFDAFIRRLEDFLGIKRTLINFEDLWSQTRPDDINSTLNDFVEHVFEWAANPDQWNGFFRGFVEEFDSRMGKPPVLNPQLRFKREFLPTITADEQAEGRRRLRVYQEWFYKNVIPASQDGYSDSLIVLPWTTGEPDYRDRYRTGPQEFTGLGFFFYNLGTYAEAPELIIPVTPTTYTSKFTGKIEQLPAAVGLIGAKGSDMMLAELIDAVLAEDIRYDMNHHEEQRPL